MSRYTDPKCKLCRRAGEKLFLKGERCYSPKCAITKRAYPPGQHGSSNNPRLSEYGLHLNEKQKLRRMYKLTEKQFRNIFVKSSNQSGVTGDNFLGNLEMRFDSLVFRLNWAKSRDLARQLITHSHLTINGKKANIPSVRLRVGDVIGIRKESTERMYFKDLLKEFPKTESSWLETDTKKYTAKIMSEPDTKHLGFDIDMSRIIEFYSR